MRRMVSVVLALSVVVIGCGATDTYKSPVDGKLTDAQIQMYLKVRGKDSFKAAEQQFNQQLALHRGSVISAQKAFAAEMRAAKDFGYNTGEYMWVKGQIATAKEGYVPGLISPGLAYNRQLLSKYENELKVAGYPGMKKPNP
jgi:hypothetical protein